MNTEEIPTSRAVCPVLEAYLELASHDLVIPETVVSLPKHGVLQSVGRLSAGANFLVSTLYPANLRDWALDGLAVEFERFGQIQSGEDFIRIGEIHQQITHHHHGPGARKERLPTNLFCTVITAYSAVLKVLGERPTERGYIRLMDTIVHGALPLAVLAMQSPTPMRQTLLDRLARALPPFEEKIKDDASGRPS